MHWERSGDRLGTRPDRSGQQDILLDQLAAAEKGSSWWRCDYHLARVIIIIMLGRGRCCADLQSTTKWTDDGVSSRCRPRSTQRSR
jgi:hypothetical protein